MIPQIEAVFTSNPGGAALGLGIILAIIVIFLILSAVFILLSIFWIWMIIDCVKRKMDDTQKVLWILLLVFLGVLAAVIYYFVVYREAKKRRS